jgi:tRNA 2-(methylsulfanyl)-N6-isopentenyladenosine37 hydroxylase
MLVAPTPEAWVEVALQDWRTLLVDHANCEKKAASTALALMFAYPEDQALTLALARLAREELRHFEQVHKLMGRLGVEPARLAPARLRALLATDEPLRKLDLMLCGALIEARSCERFERLAPRLPEPMSSFYADLARSERRHEGLYLSLARAASVAAGIAAEDFEARLALLAAAEARLATEPDTQFRFHSGAPAQAAA